jgi:hypothetical protein
MMVACSYLGWIMSAFFRPVAAITLLRDAMSIA